MEKLIYFLASAVVILIFWLLRISIKLKIVKDNVDKVHHEAEILRGKLNQSQDVDFDLSALESQVEENTQQLVSYIQEGVSKVNRDVRDLEERVDKLEEEQNDESDKLSVLEEKIEEKEEEISN